MNKWMLFLKALPIVLVVLIIKVILTEVAGFQGLMKLSEMGIILTGGVFLMGFMLAGTMTDFKESEKIPSDLAANFESLEETVNISIKNNSKFNETDYKSALLNYITKTYDWFYKKLTTNELLKEIYNFNLKLKQFEQDLAPGIYTKALSDSQNIRKTILRVDYISKTGFLTIGYALLEILIGLIALLLMVTIFENLVAEIVIVFFVMLIYIYMYKLIKDIDDPFDYEEGKEHGAAEVAIYPFTDYCERAKARLS